MFIRWVPPVVAIPCTLMDQQSVSGAMAKRLERGIKIVVGAPYASGLHSDPENPDAFYNYARASDEHLSKALAPREVAHAHGVSVAAAALQFPLLHPPLRCAIPGAVNPAQARQNCTNATATIPSKMWQEMKVTGLLAPHAPMRP